MAGRNQHHIPRFLQRGFAIEGSGGNKIWRFDKEHLPNKPSSIRSTASEANFYSEPSSDGSRTLDDEITAIEEPIAKALFELRSSDVGTLVSADVAVEVVTHLAPRTAHLRQTMTHGIHQLVSDAAEIFTNIDRLQVFLGIDKDAPNDVFNLRIEDSLRENNIIASIGLPDCVIKRIAFYIAKEQLESNFEETLPIVSGYLNELINKSGKVVRSGHNKALGKHEEQNLRREFMRTLSWRIISSPLEGAILPDCVALAFDRARNTGPLMLTDLAEIVVIIMPLSSAKLLIGTKSNEKLPQDFAYNLEAARSSHLFFLAATNGAGIANLQPLIDERSSSLIEIAVTQAFQTRVPELPITNGDSTNKPLPSAIEFFAHKTRDQWSYDLSFLDCADQSTANKISHVVKRVVAKFAQVLPLTRLDGFTFASDYAAALQGIDRGMPGTLSPTTIDQSIGIGIAQTVNIIRNGTVMCRIVMDCSVAHALITEDEQRLDWAIGMLSRQLVLVSLTEIVDVALPGILLRPIPDALQGFLYGAVGAAIDGYIAAHFCADFGDPEEMAKVSRRLLAEALDRMRTIILPARLAYRYHGNLDELLALTMPLIRHVLSFAADLLGHCAALGIEPVPSGSLLEAALNRAGLRLWLKRYYADLDAFRLRLGRWQSADEFLAFNIHVERLMWQLGMFPWSSGEGMRVEIPLASDAEALMTGLAVAAQKSK